MSIINNYTIDEQKTQAHTDDVKTTTRNRFTHETGQVLVTLGTVFKFIPPFNDHIDENTGQMLISIGRKLKSTK
ncbi:MAG: hypothetical protein IH588_15705 [Anaerolineales bacterium]|nr:hypothetical protein [Anaerolineales bacterium]